MAAGPPLAPGFAMTQIMISYGMSHLRFLIGLSRWIILREFLIWSMRYDSQEKSVDFVCWDWNFDSKAASKQAGAEFGFKATTTRGRIGIWT